MINLIAEIICSPNRKEIYDQKLIFLSNSVMADIHYDESVHDYLDSNEFWNEIFESNDKGIYKLVLKLEIKSGSSYSHYYGVDEYYEETSTTEILIKDKLLNLAEVRYVAKLIKEQNKGVL